MSRRVRDILLLIVLPGVALVLIAWAASATLPESVSDHIAFILGCQTGAYLVAVRTLRWAQRRGTPSVEAMHLSPVKSVVAALANALHLTPANASRLLIVVICLWWIGLARIAVPIGVRAARTPPLDQQLARMCEQTNRSLPRMLDDETRLDHLVALDGSHVVYEETLVNVVRRDFDDSVVPAMARAAKDAFTTNAATKRLYDVGVRPTYRLRDRDGVQIVDIPVE